MRYASIAFFLLVLACCRAVRESRADLLSAPRYIFKRGRYQNSLTGFSDELKRRELQLTEDSPVKLRWIRQRLDHFDPTNNETWLQRCWVNEEFYVPGGPQFLLLGGEAEATASRIISDNGFDWMTHAKYFGAACFYLEHRYYGESRPTTNMTTENLKWLSSDQALADIAYFINLMNEQYGFENPRWITFGGSYPGALSAWMRLKYPHLVTGAIASSGPVQVQMHFPEYLETVSDALSMYDPSCPAVIKKAVEGMQRLLTSLIGRKKLKYVLRLCTKLDVKDRLSLTNLYETIADHFSDIVQYNKDNRGIHHDQLTVDRVCSIMLNESIPDPVDRLGQTVEFYLSSYKELCLDYDYDRMIRHLRNVTFDSDDSWRQWWYQTCTEFGYYQTAASPNEPFYGLFGLNFFIDQCKAVFNLTITEEQLKKLTEEKNIQFGGRNYAGSKVVFLNGSIDPWHVLGVLENLTSDVTVIFMKGTAHCAEMYPASGKDPKVLVEARQVIRNKISLWLDK